MEDIIKHLNAVLEFAQNPDTPAAMFTEIMGDEVVIPSQEKITSGKYFVRGVICGATKTAKGALEAANTSNNEPERSSIEELRTDLEARIKAIDKELKLYISDKGLVPYPTPQGYVVLVAQKLSYMEVLKKIYILNQ